MSEPDRGQLADFAHHASLLLQHPLLRQVLDDLRQEALGDIITAHKRRQREFARSMVMAIDALRARLANRIDDLEHYDAQVARRKQIL